MLWTSLTHAKIFSNIQRKGRIRLIENYPNINFTTSDKTSGTVKFPTVYVKRMQGSAKGQTLENAQINALLFTYQIEVSTNKDQDEAEMVADVIAEIMVDMNFTMIGEPIPDNTGDTYRYVSRWQRLIGYNNLLSF